MSTSTATAGHARPGLCETLGGPAPTDPAAVLDVLVPQLHRDLTTAGREDLTKRLWQAQTWHTLWVEELRQAVGVLALAGDMAEDFPELADDRREYAELVCRIRDALHTLTPLLALLRRLLAGRCGGDLQAVERIAAAGRALTVDDRETLLWLARADLDRPATAALDRIDRLAAEALAEHAGPESTRPLWRQASATESLRRRILPTRAPPAAGAVTATA